MSLMPDLFEGKRVLVVGHSGFKGSWLTLALAEAGARVFGYSLGPPKDPRHAFHALRIPSTVMNGAAQFGDVRHFGDFERAYVAARPDFVFHVAAQAIVSEGYRDPHFTLSTNSMGVVNSLELHRRTAATGPLIVVTSDKAYRNAESVQPYSEQDALFGDDPYSASKSMAEIAAHAYSFSFPESRQRGLATVRAGNVFGGGDWSPDRLVPDCVRQLETSGIITLRMPLAVRPWTFVLDVVFGYLLVASALVDSPEASGGAWNFASGETLTVQEIAMAFAGAWDPPGMVRTGSQSIGHETNFLQIDATKARTFLQWEPANRVLDALTRTAHWYRKQAKDADMYSESVSEVRSYWRHYGDRARGGTHRLRGAQSPPVA